MMIKCNIRMYVRNSYNTVQYVEQINIARLCIGLL